MTLTKERLKQIEAWLKGDGFFDETIIDELFGHIEAQEVEIESLRLRLLAGSSEPADGGEGS